LQFDFSDIFLCASRTLMQISPFAYLLLRSWLSLQHLGSTFTSSMHPCSSDLEPCQPGVSTQPWLLLFRRCLHPLCPSRARPLCKEHPESSVQRPGSLFNLFPFNFYLGNSYGPSPVFCMRGSNSLLCCAESFTCSFLISSPFLLPPLDQIHAAL